jgi:hypothetical protein
MLDNGNNCVLTVFEVSASSFAVASLSEAMAYVSQWDCSASKRGSFDWCGRRRIPHWQAMGNQVG